MKKISWFLIEILSLIARTLLNWLFSQKKEKKCTGITLGHLREGLTWPDSFERFKFKFLKWIHKVYFESPRWLVKKGHSFRKNERILHYQKKFNGWFFRKYEAWITSNNHRFENFLQEFIKYTIVWFKLVGKRKIIFFSRK